MRHLVYFGSWRMKFEMIAGKHTASPVAHLHEATIFASYGEAMEEAIATFGDNGLANVRFVEADLRKAPTHKTDAIEKQPTLL